MATYDITELGSGLEYDTTMGQNNSIAKVPGVDRVILTWFQSSTLIYVQCFSVNTSTGALAAIGSPLDIEAGTSTLNRQRIVIIDASNAIVAWEGAANDVFLVLISIDGTGNCTVNGTATSFDVGAVDTQVDMILWDSTHVLLVWSGGGNDGFAQIFSFDTGGGTISAVGTAFEFNATNGVMPAVAQLSSSKAIVAYSGAASDGFARVLDVDGSYNVTGAGADFEFKDAVTVNSTAVVAIDTASSPMVVGILSYQTGVPNMQTFNVNTSTWAITAKGAEMQPFATGSTDEFTLPKLLLLDSTHLILSTNGTDADGFTAILSYDSGTGDLALVSSVEVSTVDAVMHSLAEIGNGIYVVAWADNTSSDGFMQTLSVELPAPGGSSYAQRRMMMGVGM